MDAPDDLSGANDAPLLQWTKKNFDMALLLCKTHVFHWAHEDVKLGNTLVSPFAVNVAITLMYLSAEQGTQRETHMVMYPKRQERDDVLEWMAMICRMILKKTDSTRHDIRLINDMPIVTWKQGQFVSKVSPSFDLKMLAQTEAKQINSKLLLVSINNDRKQDDIDKWVTKYNKDVAITMDGQLQNLMDVRLFTEEITGFILNAFFFKSELECPFSKSNTVRARFKLSENKTIKVPMMCQRNVFAYKDAGQYKVLRLRYRPTHIRLSLYIWWKKAMPENINEDDEEFDDYDPGPLKLTDLNSEQLRLLLSHLEPKYIQLRLPKFTLTNEEDLKPTLRNMTLEAPFCKESANFDKAVHYDKKKGNLWMEFINQKLVLEVDESDYQSLDDDVTQQDDDMEPENVTIDQPFCFTIMEEKTSTFLFMGHVTDPSVQEHKKKQRNVTKQQFEEDYMEMLGIDDDQSETEHWMKRCCNRRCVIM